MNTDNQASHQSFRVFENIGQRELAVTLGSVSSASRDESAEATIASSVDRPQHNRWRIIGRDFRTDEQLQSVFLRRDVCSHDTGHAVAIRYGEDGMTEFASSRHQFVGMRSSLKKSEVGTAVEFGIAHSHRRGVLCREAVDRWTELSFAGR